MAFLITMNKGNYTNKNAVENVIRYVTRTRKNEYRGNELVSYGGMGISLLSPEEMIAQFLYVQNIYNIEGRKGKRLYHEVLSLSENDFKKIHYSLKLLDLVAKKCCEIYYSQGFQVVYAIHYDEGKKYHIHFVVNSINFMTGLKWHSDFRKNYSRERGFNEYLDGKKYAIQPIEFAYDPLLL